MKVLQGVLVLVVLALLTHAAFTQWYEVGYARVLAPIFWVGFAMFFWAFLRRKPWSWRFVVWISIVEIGMNLVFWPQEKHFGSNLSFARALAAVEVVLFAAIGAFLLHPATKRWFNARDAS